MSSNGQAAVMLGRELRLRLPPQHHTSLTALAKMHGWASPTVLAESLLADAIERSARNTAMRHVFGLIANARWGCSA